MYYHVTSPEKFTQQNLQSSQRRSFFCPGKCCNLKLEIEEICFSKPQIQRDADAPRCTPPQQPHLIQRIGNIVQSPVCGGTATTVPDVLAVNGTVEILFSSSVINSTLLTFCGSSSSGETVKQTSLPLARFAVFQLLFG
jgi:hypothetical protein